MSKVRNSFIIDPIIKLNMVIQVMLYPIKIYLIWKRNLLFHQQKNGKQYFEKVKNAGIERRAAVDERRLTCLSVATSNVQCPKSQV